MRDLEFTGTNAIGSLHAYFPSVTYAGVSLWTQSSVWGDDAAIAFSDIPVMVWIIDVVPSSPTPGNTIVRDVVFSTGSSATVSGFGQASHANGWTISLAHIAASVAGGYVSETHAPWFFGGQWIDDCGWQDGTAMDQTAAPQLIEVEDVVFTRVPSPNGQPIYRGTVAVEPEFEMSSTIKVTGGSWGNSEATYTATVSPSQVKPPD